MRREFEELDYKCKIVIDSKIIEKAMKNAKIYEGVVIRIKFWNIEIQPQNI